MKRLIAIILILTLYACGQRDKTIILEKIIFHTSVCFGTCPTYHLQLEKDKSFKLYAEQVYKKEAEPFTLDFDSTKTGYFTGQASDTTFNKVIIELKNIGLDTINFNGPMYTDGPEISLIIYYNGKRRDLQSFHPTPKANKLISALYEICATSNIRRSDKKFVIENEKASR